MKYEDALMTLGLMLNECEKEEPNWEHMKELTRRYNVAETADMPCGERALWRSAGTDAVVFYTRKHGLGESDAPRLGRVMDFYKKHFMERIY